MRVEQVDTLYLPTTESVQDSIVLPAIFHDRNVSVREEIPFDTITPKACYTGTWKAIPLKEHQDVGFISEILVYAILFFGILAFVRLLGRGLFVQLFSNFFSRKNQEKFMTEERHSSSFLSFLTFVLSISAISMFAVYWISGTIVLEVFFLAFGLLFCYHFVILGWITFLGWIFNAHACAKEIRSNVWVYNTVLGLIMAPLVIVLFYVQGEWSKSIIYAIFSIFFIYLIFRFIRMIKILFDHRVSILYMILYLCALEILPFLVLCKILGRIVQASVN